MIELNGRRIAFGVRFSVTVGTDFSGTGCQINTDRITSRLHYDILFDNHAGIVSRRKGKNIVNVVNYELILGLNTVTGITGRPSYACFYVCHNLMIYKVIKRKG